MSRPVPVVSTVLSPVRGHVYMTTNAVEWTVEDRVDTTIRLTVHVNVNAGVCDAVFFALVDGDRIS